MDRRSHFRARTLVRQSAHHQTSANHFKKGSPNAKARTAHTAEHAETNIQSTLSANHQRAPTAISAPNSAPSNPCNTLLTVRLLPAATNDRSHPSPVHSSPSPQSWQLVGSSRTRWRQRLQASKTRTGFIPIPSLHRCRVSLGGIVSKQALRPILKQERARVLSSLPLAEHT